MDIESIREIGKETRAQDLLDLVRGERILLKGVGTDTQEESGVVVWKWTNEEFNGRFLVALRTDIEKRSDHNFNPITCQFYNINQYSVTSIPLKEEGMRRWKTREISPGHYLSFENTDFTKYNQLLENVDL